MKTWRSRPLPFAAGLRRLRLYGIDAAAGPLTAEGEFRDILVVVCESWATPLIVGLHEAVRSRLRSGRCP